jgi:hypothetical protein
MFWYMKVYLTDCHSSHSHKKSAVNLIFFSSFPWKKNTWPVTLARCKLSLQVRKSLGRWWVSFFDFENFTTHIPGQNSHADGQLVNCIAYSMWRNNFCQQRSSRSAVVNPSSSSIHTHKSQKNAGGGGPKGQQHTQGHTGKCWAERGRKREVHPNNGDRSAFIQDMLKASPQGEGERSLCTRCSSRKARWCYCYWCRWTGSEGERGRRMPAS